MTVSCLAALPRLCCNPTTLSFGTALSRLTTSQPLSHASCLLYDRSNLSSRSDLGHGSLLRHAAAPSGQSMTRPIWMASELEGLARRHARFKTGQGWPVLRWSPTELASPNLPKPARHAGQRSGQHLLSQLQGQRSIALTDLSATSNSQKESMSGVACFQIGLCRHAAASAGNSRPSGAALVILRTCSRNGSQNLGTGMW